MSMTLKDRIPKEFYSLFRTKNMDAYMQIVVALYEENNEVYASLGLTREECQIIIADTISKTGIPVEISTSTCTGIALIPSKTAVLTVLYIYTPIPIGVNA